MHSLVCMPWFNRVLLLHVATIIVQGQNGLCSLIEIICGLCSLIEIICQRCVVTSSANTLQTVNTCCKYMLPEIHAVIV